MTIQTRAGTIISWPRRGLPRLPPCPDQPPRTLDTNLCGANTPSTSVGWGSLSCWKQMGQPRSFRRDGPEEAF